jgi:hypothetical protein
MMAETAGANRVTYNGVTESCPTVLFVKGWRVYFYSNEGNEPMHVHAVKGEAECKYWLHPDRFDVIEEFEYHLRPRLRREIRQIIFEHFDQIVAAWREHFGGNSEE